jgi:hypothetical protein
LGFTCSNTYVDSGSHPDEQQHHQQWQYWSRLAAVGARMCTAGSGRDVSMLCYAFAAADVTVGRKGCAWVRQPGLAGHMHPCQ